MIDERFSEKAFQDRGFYTKEADDLADQLKEEIQQELYNVLAPAFSQIIEKLNSMGHNLRLYYEPEPDDIHYRDFIDETGNRHKMLLAVDIVLSVGYPSPVRSSGASGYALNKGELMKFLRTPDERFENLEGSNFKPHYADILDMRMHFIDEPGTSGETVLLLHGEPSWCYLYRKMIPIINAAGHRVVAPDFFGFGRSDKPVSRSDYSYQFHVDSLTALLKELNLSNITLFCQDWGGLIGLRVAAENPDRFSRIVAANTFLPTGDRPAGEAFLRWREYSQTVPEFHAGGIIKGAVVNKPSPEVIAGYDAPYPDESYKAGARAFPLLVPITPDNPASAANRKAWEVLVQWQKPFLTLFSDSDPITRGGDAAFQKLIPGTQGQPHKTIIGAGHFLQEDKGEELAELIVDFIART